MSSRTPALPWKGHLQLLVSHPVFITSGSQDGYCGFSHFSFTSAFQGRMKVGWYVKALFLRSSVIFSWDRDSSNQLSPISLWREQIHMSTSNPILSKENGTVWWFTKHSCSLMPGMHAFSHEMNGFPLVDILLPGKTWSDCLLGSQQTVCESKQWND